MKPVDCSLPETMLTVMPGAEAGVPIDAITAACGRAEAVLDLLMGQFEAESDQRFADSVILNVLWDVQGTLALVKKLALYGHATSDPSTQIGGAQ